MIRSTVVEHKIRSDKAQCHAQFILFDENMELVADGSGAFQANGKGSWIQIGTTQPMEIPVNGYLVVYLSTASRSIDVFFDQLVLRFTKGMQRGTSLLSFGLPMAGMGKLFKSIR